MVQSQVQVLDTVDSKCADLCPHAVEPDCGEVSQQGRQQSKFVTGARMVAMVEDKNGPDPAPPGV